MYEASNIIKNLSIYMDSRTDLVSEKIKPTVQADVGTNTEESTEIICNDAIPRCYSQNPSEEYHSIFTPFNGNEFPNLI